MSVAYADLHALLDTVTFIAIFLAGIWIGHIEKKSRKKVLDKMKKDKK